MEMTKILLSIVSLLIVTTAFFVFLAYYFSDIDSEGYITMRYTGGNYDNQK
jgi:hypothetical protein